MSLGVEDLRNGGVEEWRNGGMEEWRSALSAEALAKEERIKGILNFKFWILN